MKYLIVAVITAGLFGSEYILGRLKYCAFGGILPLLFLVFSIVTFSSGKLALKPEYIFPFIILFLALLSSWIHARESRKKILQKELSKMEASDLKK